MKPFLFRSRKSCSKSGFSLVEATFSIGLMSFGLLTLVPLLALGLKTSRGARDDRATAQIAQTLIEQAKQGSLSAGTSYFDNEGNGSSSADAVYTVQTTVLPVAGSVPLERLTLQVTPRGASNGARTYAVLIPSSP